MDELRDKNNTCGRISISDLELYEFILNQFIILLIETMKTIGRKRK